MLIDVSNKVIIFDEAHNMEDCARDAASLTVNSDQLAELTKEMEEISEFDDGPCPSKRTVYCTHCIHTLCIYVCMCVCMCVHLYVCMQYHCVQFMAAHMSVLMP